MSDMDPNKYEFLCALGCDAQMHWWVRYRETQKLIVAGSSSPDGAWADACRELRQRIEVTP